MPDKEREQEPEFKVTDRRLFTPDGQRRLEVEPEPRRTETAPPPPQTPKRPAPPPPPAGQTPREEAPKPPRPERQGPVSFEQLVMSLATTAMFQLGLVHNPGEDNQRTDFPAAKETIDLLEILQEKTKGNLTQEEDSLLSGSLYELRMAFVELSRRGARNR